MKKNWFVLIMSVISAILMCLFTTLMFNFIIKMASSSGTSATEMSTLSRVSYYYRQVVYVEAIINVLFGLWGTFKKPGCTALMIWAIISLMTGGIFIFLIPAILNFVAASKGKNKIVTYQAEQQALAKAKAEQANEVEAEDNNEVEA